MLKTLALVLTSGALLLAGATVYGQEGSDPQNADPQQKTGQQAPGQEKNAAACTDVHQLTTSVTSLTKITPQSTIGDVKSAAAGIQDAEKKLSSNTEAEKAAPAQMRNLKSAVDTLEKSTKNLSDKTTIAQAHQRLRNSVARVTVAEKQLSQKLGCPKAAK
jgi:hypothetical protein